MFMRSVASGSTERCQIEDGNGMVGIFWLIEAHDSMYPLSNTVILEDSEAYGDCLGSPISHYEAWEAVKCGSLMVAKIGPPIHNLIRETECEDWPRGRVIFNTGRARCTVYADRQAFLYAGIIRQTLCLPLAAEFRTDLHYRNARRITPRMFS